MIISLDLIIFKNCSLISNYMCFYLLILCPKFASHLDNFNKHTHMCEKNTIEFNEREDIQDICIFIDTLSNFAGK